jgi:phosphatidylethanolamine/phosphatidyl-N-methylethanolamine N-methyltransferase
VLHEHVLFLEKFLRSPIQTGAVAPSSVHLADRITSGIGLEEAGIVVELGPGTGAFTGAIVKRSRRGARLIAVELDPKFAQRVQGLFPEVQVLNIAAEDLPRHLGPGAAVDSVVSGLPWAAFDSVLQSRILSAVCSVLRPGGRFATFAYAHAAWLPPGQRFRKLLDESFSKVELTPVVWKNLPPAFVYRCQK